jgi:hypothetical protein
MRVYPAQPPSVQPLALHKAHHFGVLCGLRRGLDLKPGSGAPSLARRRALSRAINASNPMRTSAVFLETPVNRAARRMRDGSMFKVVRMYAL